MGKEQRHELKRNANAGLAVKRVDGAQETPERKTFGDRGARRSSDLGERAL